MNKGNVDDSTVQISTEKLLKMCPKCIFINTIAHMCLKIYLCEQQLKDIKNCCMRKCEFLTVYQNMSAKCVNGCVCNGKIAIIYYII